MAEKKEKEGNKMKYQIYYGTEPIKELQNTLREAEDLVGRLAEEDYMEAYGDDEQSFEYYQGFYEIREVKENDK